ncbi:TerB N-terminal domain-containing protein [Pseudarthrobacter sp. NPDC080039]|uniref:TerB N-terminal domain-containing protein n=1 Tax=unclassified Pseudarthrobacter TaxID=2647000 RepID=UPI00344B6D3F
MVGFYVRKSLKAGPFRFNLSKSGLGVSAGVPGFRVGSGPRGNYVRMGSGGVFYQASLGDGRRPSQAGQHPRLPAASIPASADVVFEDQRGASIQALAPTSANDLVQQLNEAAGRKPLTRWVVIAVVLLGLITMPFGLLIWLLGIPLIWWVVQRDRGRRSVVIFYDVNDEHARQFQALVDAGNSLGQSQKLWRINEAGSLRAGYQQKVNAGATALVGRSVVGVTHNGPRELMTNIAVPGVTADGTSMYFLPDRILLGRKGAFTDIPYASLRIQERLTNFIESPGVTPSDAVQVGSTWQYVNKKGGPDRRFKNNPVLPIMKYTELELSTVAGFRWIFQVSSAQAASFFAKGLHSAAAFEAPAIPAPGFSSPPSIPEPVDLPELAAPPPAEPALVPVPENKPPMAEPALPAAAVKREPRWCGANESLDLGHGIRIPGMVYAGQGLTSPRGGVEPSLIDPTLRVDHRNPDLSGECLGYWPSYADITPAGRAAYLAWLAQGRRVAETPIGYVFLFMYGLERRVFVDIAKHPELAPELIGIRSEMNDLLTVYGDSHGSFDSYASRFIDVIDFLMLQAVDDFPSPPALTESQWEVPVALRVVLGTFAADGKTIPADWALAWAWFHPEIAVRTPATRCTEEFTRLFRLCYRRSYGDGFTVRPGASKVRLDYTTASSQIGVISMTIGETPDVFALRAPQKKLAALFDEVTAELDAYSRWLGRNPDKAGSLAAAALLPNDLLVDADGPVGDFRAWVQGKLEDHKTVEISGKALFEHWQPNNTEKLSKPEAVNLAALLDSFEVGIEPDVRFGGQAITTITPVILFRTQPGSPHSATSSYNTALTMTHMAAAVIAADDDVSAMELDHLSSHLESSLQLTEPERTRLRAHLQWLVASKVKLTGLTKRLNTLTDAQKAAWGDMLVTLAAADGRIAPSEVSILQKIYKLLDLDTSMVTSRLHSVITGQNAPAAGPVMVRPAGNLDPGYPIPAPPTLAAPEAAPSGRYSLDAPTIQAKLAETAEVSALLGDIFSEDTPGTTDSPAPPNASPGTSPAEESAAPAVGDLDPAHSKLVRALAGREQLPWTDFEDLAAQYGLLPEGAKDTVNEAALDASDEPLLEGDETLTINSYALQELLA